MNQILHFTLGPVQGFIADARRTRDLWAGSFLLSWLAGNAMAALHEAQGDIIFPKVVNDELFEAIMAVRTGNPITGFPYIGSLPNRFKADISNVQGDATAICEKAINKSWRHLADTVYKNFVTSEVAELSKGGSQGIKEIWDRQVHQFWSINWVIGPDSPQNGMWLDQRKNWRTHWQADEGGDLCRLMGRFQELSGYHRISSKPEQSKFWDVLSSSQSIGPLNIRQDERLCAIALIKRLFPLVAEDVIGWGPGGDALDIKNWPSVSYIAAVPWLKTIEAKQCNHLSYSEAAQAALKSGYLGETATKLFNLPHNRFYGLDGQLLFADGIANRDIHDFRGDTEAQKQKSMLGLQQALSKFSKEIEYKAPSEFYAVLLMDGDSIGARIDKQGELISRGLSQFTEKVKALFNPSDPASNPFDGALIYAGGDDVLALLPLENAIDAAVRIRGLYDEAFAEAKKALANSNEDNSGSFTMSGAILFAHYKNPMRAVLRKAHSYLDDIAKDKNGRDSLALAVMKPGGIAYDWVSCWKTSQGTDDQRKPNPVKALNSIVQDIAGQTGKYSTGFLYNIRERYSPLFMTHETNKTGEVEISSDFADPEVMHAVLKAEYKKQPGKNDLTSDQVDEAINPFHIIGLPLNQTNDRIEASNTYYFEGALVARFLGSQSIVQKSMSNDSAGNRK